jgi:hypothetical protein
MQGNEQAEKSDIKEKDKKKDKKGKKKQKGGCNQQ